MKGLDLRLLKCLIGFLALTGLQGCGVSVKDDWYDYQRVVRPDYAELKSAVTAVRELDDPTIQSVEKPIRVLRNEVLPRLRRITGHLENIHPKTPRVQEVHNHYLTYMSTYTRAIEVVTTSMETGQPAKASESTSLMNKASQHLKRAQSQIDSLNAEFGRAP